MSKTKSAYLAIKKARICLIMALLDRISRATAMYLQFESIRRFRANNRKIKRLTRPSLASFREMSCF
jgi:hypothetical protein